MIRLDYDRVQSVIDSGTEYGFGTFYDIALCPLYVGISIENYENYMQHMAYESLIDKFNREYISWSCGKLREWVSELPVNGEEYKRYGLHSPEELGELNAYNAYDYYFTYHEYNGMPESYPEDDVYLLLEMHLKELHLDEDTYDRVYEIICQSPIIEKAQKLWEFDYHEEDNLRLRKLFEEEWEKLYGTH